MSFAKCLTKYDEPVVFWIKVFEYFLSLVIPLEGEQFLTAFSFGGWPGSA